MFSIHQAVQLLFRIVPSGMTVLHKVASSHFPTRLIVFDNVTWADNYYQTVANPNGLTATPNGRSLSQLPQEELNKNPKPAGLNFPQANGVNLGKADREILLGIREGEPDRENSRIGFTKDDDDDRTLKIYRT